MKKVALKCSTCWWNGFHRGFCWDLFSLGMLHTIDWLHSKRKKISFTPWQKPEIIHFIKLIWNITVICTSKHKVNPMLETPYF